MSLRHIALASVLTLAAVTSAHAYQFGEPNQTCKMPPLPESRATQADWQNYKSNLKSYQECMAAKAEKVGKVTKKALETVGEGATKAKEGVEAVGEKVIGWKETASGWFAN
jgi:hypothetical protein